MVSVCVYVCRDIERVCMYRKIQRESVCVYRNTKFVWAEKKRDGERECVERKR